MRANMLIVILASLNAVMGQWTVHHAGMYPGPPGAQSPVYYPGSVRIPNGEYPLGSMRVPLGEDFPGMHAATPAHMGSLDPGFPARPASASWREPDGLSVALLRNRDSELADIFAAPGV